MIDITEAIFALNSSITHIVGGVAYDKDNNEVDYDKSAAEAKLAELQKAEASTQAAKATAEQSAISKLTALGLTADEIAALRGQ